jgi:hypothetical protein
MPKHIAIAATQTFLGAAEQDVLIATIQDVPVEHLVLDDGTERLVFRNTTAADAAMDQLLGSYVKLIEKTASRATVISREDAQSELMLAFIEAVRRHDITKGVPFHRTIGAILYGALSVAQGTSDVIVIPETIALRYWRVMHDADMDVQVAYESCGKHNLASTTFLAVHHALTIQSLDVSVGASNGDSEPGREMGFVAASPEADIVTADLVRWLFEQVTDTQETIIRARYGFCDDATETILVAHGLHLGDVISDIQVAEVTGIGAKTVQRQRVKGLASMKAAYIAALDEA